MEKKIEELPLGIFVKVASVIYYFLGRLGNFLLLGIVHYEKFGQDPQKRSLQDRLLTFNALDVYNNLLSKQYCVVILKRVHVSCCVF